MRFLGNKDSITHEIFQLLESKNLTKKDLTLFDAFCGTGSISDSLKGEFNIVANDLLKWCTIYTRGRLTAQENHFNDLGIDPFDFFNSNNEAVKGFFYENYSPGNSKRMYFTPENAGRIDYFRTQIEKWKNDGRINHNEHSYLLACLIESVSKVANTAGVYGAFLKHWDPRALKPIKFITVEYNDEAHLNFEISNNKIEDITDNLECDILYLDPPYTQNQYGTQYHIFETLVLDDDPTISKVTGSRPTGPMRSDWSKAYKAHILLDKIVAKTKAKYIVFSYSTDGIMSKSFIEACLKRYGVKGSYSCKKISYKKYRNFKTKRTNEHFEYLFFVEKKDLHEVQYESPLNYIGSKSKMIGDIKKYLPNERNTFIDAFGGGFNVGINAEANQIIFNEINNFVVQLVESFCYYDTYDYLMFIKRTIKKFGLEKESSESYLEARSFYNSKTPANRDPRILYTVILYGFNQQIRFNSDYEFNNPVGMRWFNDKVLEKMISFSRVIKEKNVQFSNVNFTELLDSVSSNNFVYMDPPYRLTRGSYNDGKRGFEGWTRDHEQMLFDVSDELTNKGNKFMISYVSEHGGIKNNELEQWVKQRGYRMIGIPPIPGRKRKEVLIINYEK